jgi:hypothetical protein
LPQILLALSVFRVTQEKLSTAFLTAPLTAFRLQPDAVFVRYSKFSWSTSELGQKQTWRPEITMSALLPKADFGGRELDVCFVPEGFAVSGQRRSIQNHQNQIRDQHDGRHSSYRQR